MNISHAGLACNTHQTCLLTWAGSSVLFFLRHKRDLKSRSRQTANFNLHHVTKFSHYLSFVMITKHVWFDPWDSICSVFVWSNWINVQLNLKIACCLILSLRYEHKSSSFTLTYSNYNSKQVNKSKTDVWTILCPHLQ